MEDKSPKGGSELTSTSFSKKFLLNTVIGVIFLSILSSALWEKIISPFSMFAFTKILYVVSLISNSFSDSLYKEISKGFHESSGLSMLSIVLTAIGTYFLLYSLRNFHNVWHGKHDHTSVDLSLEDITADIHRLKKSLRKISLAIFIFGIFVFFYYTYFNGRATYINSVTTTTLNNIEIVSPYITDVEYKTLKSQFYSMESKDNFTALTNAIIEIANTSHTKLK